MEVMKHDQHSYVKIAILRRRNALECHKELQEALGVDSVPYRTVANWARAFKRAKKSAADLPWNEDPVLEEKDMLDWCAAPGCSSNFKSGRKQRGYVRLFLFPKDEKLRALWAQAVPRKNWQPTNTSYLCIRHFDPNDVEFTEVYVDKQGIRKEHPRGKPILRKNAVPTVFLDVPPNPDNVKKFTFTFNRLKKKWKEEEKQPTPMPSFKRTRTKSAVQVVTRGIGVLQPPVGHMNSSLEPTVQVVTRGIGVLQPPVGHMNSSLESTTVQDAMVNESDLQPPLGHMDSPLEFPMDDVTESKCDLLPSVSHMNSSLESALQDVMENSSQVAHITPSVESMETETLCISDVVSVKCELQNQSQSPVPGTSGFSGSIPQPAALDESVEIKEEPIWAEESVDAPPVEAHMIVLKDSSTSELQTPVENEIPTLIKVEELYYDSEDEAQDEEDALANRDESGSSEISETEDMNWKMAETEDVNRNSETNFDDSSLATDIKMEIPEHIRETVDEIPERKPDSVDETTIPKCEICGKTFKRISNAKKHVQRHYRASKPPKPSKFPCSICGKVLLYMSTFKMHMSRHEGNGRFPCDICNKRFGSKFSLKTHKLFHSSERPYECTMCDKAFAIRSNLNKHEMIHRGERRFTCEHCGKSFMERSYLLKHQELHNQESLVHCSMCPMTFKYRKSLEKHEARHTAPQRFPCLICHKVFNYVQTFNRHVKIHTKPNSNMDSEESCT